MTSRRKATLYLPMPARTVVEAIRCRFNPVQFNLIKAHVTLCREDEVPDWSELESRLATLKEINITISFGRPRRDGNLIYLPAMDSTESFDSLRSVLLSTKTSQPRKHNAHLTLVHPRNGSCSDAEFCEISNQVAPFTAVFREVSLIQQIDSGPWHDLATFGNRDTNE